MGRGRCCRMIHALIESCGSNLGALLCLEGQRKPLQKKGNVSLALGGTAHTKFGRPERACLACLEEAREFQGGLSDPGVLGDSGAGGQSMNKYVSSSLPHASH